ncbi:hypothetical protein G9A89_013875 [Geosiphon pyriformis]|nr:hypothetical protein G9A89_013875 [Geosiphon pyriformis]
MLRKKLTKLHQQLGLTNNHYLVESVFNFYVNERITDFLKKPVDIESVRENFYTELIQHTSLSQNYSFTPIIRKINQKIERYTQQQFSIIYTNKSKRKIESSLYLSYYYTPRSTINIASAVNKRKQSYWKHTAITLKDSNHNYQCHQDSNYCHLHQISESQQLPLQQLQQPNLDPMAYAPIAKLKKFTGKENNTQVWLNDVKKVITANE